MRGSDLKGLSGKLVRSRAALFFSTMACALLLMAATSQAQDSPASSTAAPKTATITHHKASGKKRKSRKAASRARGQKQIDPKRARDIQQALIREHYLTGEGSGVWDDATQKAMQRYQADNGWQSKTTPDARALIKLGLGPDQEHLLNPESAMTTPTPTPSAAHGAPAATAAGPAEPQTQR